MMTILRLYLCGGLLLAGAVGGGWLAWMGSREWKAWAGLCLTCAAFAFFFPVTYFLLSLGLVAVSFLPEFKLPWLPIRVP